MSDIDDEDYDNVDRGDDSAYVDEIAVERRCAGDHTVTLNRAEALEAFSRLERKGMSAAKIAERLGTTSRSIVRWRTGAHAPVTLRGANVTTPAPSPIGTLLENASGHGNARVRRLAEKVERHLDDLRALMAEDTEKEKVRKEVADLERKLAEAKARLKAGTVTAIRSPRTLTRNLDPLPCRKGCGRVCAGAQGRGAHERNCAPEAAAS